MQAKEKLGPAYEVATGAIAAAETAAGGQKPLLLVDIDGVISLFGASFASVSAERRGSDGAAPKGSFHSIEGIPHFFSSAAAAHLLELWPLFELVWASGWEERANEHLPHLLGLPEALPFLSFSRALGVAGGVQGTQATKAHWKLSAIDAYAGERPLAWIDDALDSSCHEWARSRRAATLLVQTAPEAGLTAKEAGALARWAGALAAR